MRYPARRALALRCASLRNHVETSPVTYAELQTQCGEEGSLQSCRLWIDTKLYGFVFKMVRSCVYPGCENRFKPKRLRPLGDEVTAHKFPLTNHERLKLWLLALHLDINTPLHSLEQKRVCSEHFLDDDYRPFVQGKPRLLKPSSVPITCIKQEQVCVYVFDTLIALSCRC